MGPIETLWVAIILVFIVVALARGYPNELGVTLMMFAALLLLVGFGAEIEMIADALLSSQFGFHFREQPGIDVFLWLFYTTSFMAVVTASYLGKTFGYPVKPITGPAGTILSILVGLVNGYLFTGTVWYYMDRYNYPLAERLGYVDVSKFTPVAKVWLQILPPKIFTTEMFILIVVLLLLLRVRK